MLQHAYINVKDMQAERPDLATDSNDPKNPLQVLILLADVSIVGLDLHWACSTVFLMSTLRNMASEVQLWGRLIRVNVGNPLGRSAGADVFSG